MSRINFDRSVVDSEGSKSEYGRVASFPPAQISEYSSSLSPKKKYVVGALGAKELRKLQRRLEEESQEKEEEEEEEEGHGGGAGK